MTDEGMVHALERIRDALKPGGWLADLRPERDRRSGFIARVCGAVGRDEIYAGDLRDPPADYRTYRAAARASDAAVRRGLYDLASADSFLLRYHFRTVDTLDEYLDTRWIGARVDAPTRRRLRSLLRATPSAHVVIVEPLRLNVMRKRRG